MNKQVYRPEIDGLRAFSVIAVILYHYGFSSASGGFIGVDVFFVISGYLISSIILHELSEGKFSLFEFYVRRIKRIIPIAFVVIAATCLMASVFAGIFDRESTFSSALFAAASLANFYFLAGSGYFASDASTQPLLHFWSLAVEEQFYLFWPVMLVLLCGLFKKDAFISLFTLGLAAISFALCLKTTGSSPSEAFYLPQNRIWELLVGAILATIRPLGISRIGADLLRSAGIVTLVLCVVVFNDKLPFPGPYALAPCVAAAAIVAPLRSRGHVDQGLSMPAVRLIGLISYSLYLWHWPVLVAYRGFTGEQPAGGALLIILAGVFVLSYLTWRFIEVPVRRWSPPSVVKGLVCATFAAILSCGVYAWTASAPGREWTAERYIVREQIRRAALEPAPTIGFFGDSSCLTGVYSPLLSSDLKTDVASYCMFGSAGPFADATAIRRLKERGEQPDVIVYMVHPAQFQRTTVVTDWNEFATASAENRDGVLQMASVSGARLKGAFTERYTRSSQLVEELRHTGSLVDPGSGVRQAIPVLYQLSTAYKASLSPLVDVLSQSDRNRVYLVLAPIPAIDEQGDRGRAAAELAQLLGIPQTNILNTPPVMAEELFAKNTHLNERGREVFSHALVRSLSGVLTPAVSSKHKSSQL